MNGWIDGTFKSLNGSFTLTPIHNICIPYKQYIAVFFSSLYILSSGTNIFSVELLMSTHWDTPLQLSVLLFRLRFIPSTGDVISFGAPHTETQRVHTGEAGNTVCLHVCGMGYDYIIRNTGHTAHLSQRENA